MVDVWVWIGLFQCFTELDVLGLVDDVVVLVWEVDDCVEVIW